ncbi:LPXTG cell wall anchor domain-containing protein [Streptomyces griseoviridis]|uniref:LPXTG cell wall anchor domain-containing protein n=1 Tax=Streptomyces griseoviridis TaxID=45398 RepID=UPI00167ADD04|nr:LPXTG cell wall anchor domain-containing protein [Streptomyces niveoruber]
MPSRFNGRCRGAAVVLGLTVALPLCAGTPAHAEDAKDCGRVGVEYTADRGQHWLTSGRITQDAPVTRIDVRLKEEPAQGCRYAVSLASYSTEGPTWETSGTQTFLGSDTVVLTKDLAQSALDVSAFAPECFGQIDLYSGDRTYDGVDAPLPHYPVGQMDDSLIAYWNGGTECATPPPADSPAPTPGASTPPGATPGTTPPAPSPSGTPDTPAPATSAPPAPSPSSTTPRAAVVPGPSTHSTVPGTLASTGSDSGTTTALTLTAAALVGLGGGAYLLARRRRHG